MAAKARDQKKLPVRAKRVGGHQIMHCVAHKVHHPSLLTFRIGALKVFEDHHWNFHNSNIDAVVQKMELTRPIEAKKSRNAGEELR